MNYLADRLDQGNVRASINVTNWSGTCYATPLLGAFLADAYLGRYWTIAVFSIIYFFVSQFKFLIFKTIFSITMTDIYAILCRE